MRILPVVFIWREVDIADEDGVLRKRKVMDPHPRYDNVAARQYDLGEEHTLIIQEARSRKSHNAYFAQIHTAFENLPETIAARWPTEEHLRKWALIETGWFEEKDFDFEGDDAKRDAERLGKFIRVEDDYVRIKIRKITPTHYKVIIRRAKSQAMNVMRDKETFEASKKAVLDLLEHMIGVASGTLKEEAGMSA